jgi:UDP-N-acetyl-D-mannosaminuronate dehydrogenase
MRILVIGAGTIGLPFGLTLADTHHITFIDNNNERLAFLKSPDSCMPDEPGVDELKKKNAKTIEYVGPEEIQGFEFDVVVFAINFSNGSNEVLDIYNLYRPYCDSAGCVLFRSTLNNHQWKALSEVVDTTKFAYVPERSRPGDILKELAEIPQIIGHESTIAFSKSKEIFDSIVSDCLGATVIEAIAIKLLSNSWRTGIFDLANNFFMDCKDRGLDFTKICTLAKKNYPRLDSLALQGFISGPCLPKDYESWIQWNGQTHLSVKPFNEKLLQLITRELFNKYQDVTSLKVAFIGKGYRSDYPDSRGSMTKSLQTILEKFGVEVTEIKDANLAIHLFPGQKNKTDIDNLNVWESP